jgi:hypothetical protein
MKGYEPPLSSSLRQAEYSRFVCFPEEQEKGGKRRYLREEHKECSSERKVR